MHRTPLPVNVTGVTDTQRPSETQGKTYRTLSSTSYYVTLTGEINPAADNGGIGPSIMTVRVVEATNVETGQVYSPTYTVAYDGHDQHCGFAAHMVDGMPEPGDTLRIVHAPVAPVAPVAANIHITQRPWGKIHRDYKTTIDGNRFVLAYTEGAGTCLVAWIGSAR